MSPNIFRNDIDDAVELDHFVKKEKELNLREQYSEFTNFTTEYEGKQYHWYLV